MAVCAVPVVVLLNLTRPALAAGLTLLMLSAAARVGWRHRRRDEH